MTALAQQTKIESPLEGALFMASRGFAVFPLMPGSKKPFEVDECGLKHRRLAGGINRATRDPEKIRRWAAVDPDICINFGVSAHDMVVLDVDVKHDANAALEEYLELQLPRTFTVFTPTGGWHEYFKGPPTGQPKLGKCIDVRSQGGYVVAPGSRIDGATYDLYRDAELGELPETVREKIGKAGERNRQLNAMPTCDLDLPHNVARANEMAATFEKAEEGGRNHAAYSGACRLKDLGVSQETAFEIMGSWNARNGQPLEDGELQNSVENAFRHGQNQPGCCTAEAEFDGLADEVAELKLPAAPPRRELIFPAMIPGGRKGEERPDPNSIRNVVRLLEYLRVAVLKNTFSGEVEVQGLRDHSLLNDTALNCLWAMAREHGLGITFDAFTRLMHVAAERNRFHPVIEYLESLKWDGRPRVDTWLSEYVGAEASKLNSEFGRVFLLGAVRRVLEPGCKFDYALVLEGPQNAGKSSVAMILGGPWHGDCLKLGMDSKQTIEQTRGTWIQELPELSGMQNRDVEAIKAQITTQHDKARAAYARLPETVPRQFVLMGTTNSASYLKDRTGNRRFLPVRVGAIHLEALKRERDQLWAEAYQRAKTGEQTVLSPTVWEDAREAQAARVEVDDIKERLTDLLDGVAGRVLKVDLWRALGRAVNASIPQRDMNSLACAMAELGWQPGRQRWTDGKLSHCFEKGNSEWLQWDGADLVKLSVDSSE